MEAAIGDELRRLIGQRILAAKLVLDLAERLGYFLHLRRKENTAAGGFRKTLHHLIAARLDAADVGADGVDNHFGSLCHLDGLLAGYAALIVLAVREQNDGPPGRPLALRLGQFGLRGFVNRVKQRRSTARTQHANAVRQAARVIREVLRYLRERIKAEHKRLVGDGTDNLAQKLNCRVLLEAEAVADGTAGIDQQTHPQGQVGLTAEAGNGGGLTVVQNLYVVAPQVLYEMPVSVCDREYQVHLVHGLDDGRSGVRVVAGSRTRC